MRGAGGEYVEGLQPERAGTLLDALQQFVATATVAVLRVDRQAGQFAGIRVGDRVQRGAGDDQAIALDDAELADLALQHFARTAHQDALVLQRSDQLDQAADVLDGRLAQRLELLLVDQGAAAVTGKQLGEQRAVFHVADDMAALDPTAAGLGGGVEQLGLVAATQARQVRRHLLRAQLAHQLAGLVEQAALGGKQQQRVGLQVDGGAGGDVLAGQVEDFPGGRVAERREQHDAALVEQAANALAVDPAHFTGVVIVDAVDHADWPRGDEVAAGDAQA